LGLSLINKAHKKPLHEKRGSGKPLYNIPLRSMLFNGIIKLLKYNYGIKKMGGFNEK